MKKTLLITTLLLVVSLLLGACTQPVDEGIWETATYKSDTTVGEGANTATVEVKTEDKSVTITLKTDKTNLGEALYAAGLTNDPTFFDTMNGMQLVWDECHAYWGFYINGEYATVGVGDVTISGTDKYSFVYTKG